MKKRCFVSLLVCILTICLFCASVFAAEDTAPEAKIGTTEYQTLQEALAEVKKGDTVVLLTNVTFGQNLFIPDGVTLDLGGKTLTAGNQIAVGCSNGTEVTVKNGTLTGGSIATVYNAGGTLTLDNCEVITAEGTGSAVQNGFQNAKNCSITLKNTTVTAGTGQTGIFDQGENNSISMTNCNVTGSYWAIYHNGSDGGFELTAENSTITCDGAWKEGEASTSAIYVSGSTATTEAAGHNQQIKLTGCTVTGPTGIEGKYADMVLTDCDITATAETISFEQYNNGSTALGFAVVSTDNSMQPNSPAPEATITINGGNYQGTVGLSKLDGIEEFEGFKEAEFTVTGGTFSGDVSDYIAEDADEVVYNTVLKAPNCTENGIGKRITVVEGKESVSYYVLPAAHKWVADAESTENLAPTCGKDGVKAYKCSVCEEPKTEAIPATGKHTFVDKAIDATCTEPEMAGKVCSVCGAVDGELVVVEGSKPLGHDMVPDMDREDYVEATCGKEGSAVYKCSRCDYAEEEARTIPATGEHVEEVVDAKEPTCGEPGNTDGLKCSVCGEILMPWTEIPATNKHTEVNVEAVAPNCKEAGSTEGIKCSECGQVLSGCEEIPANSNAHEAVLDGIALKAPTCTTIGIGKYKCEKCEISLGYKTIPASHSWVAETTTDATCGEDGETVYKCSVCNETKTEVIPATGKHTWGEEQIIEATCTEPAKVGQKCEVCGAEGETKPVANSEPLGHDMVLDTTNEAYVAADCEKGGLDTFKCSRCDVTEEKATEALGHKWNEGVHQDATCDTASGVLYTCEACDKTMVEEYPEGVGEPALGHKPVAMENVAATCKDAGSNGGTKCSVCGETLEQPTVIPADPNAHKAGLIKTLKEANCKEGTTGIGKYACELCEEPLGYKIIPVDHNWNEGVVTKAATCAEDGEKTLTCSVCAETKIEMIPATGEHSFEEKVIDATCTEPDKVGQVCTVCKAEGETKPVEDSEPLGHDMVLDTTNEAYVAATCEEGGLDTFKCSRCDVTEEKATEALGHKWNDGEYAAADCVNGAGVKYTCTVCGETYVEELTGDVAEPALGHKEQAEKDVPATCKNPGVTGKIICSVCGEVLNAGTEIPVDENAHVYGEPRVMKEATCTKTGIGKYTCTECGKVEYKTIPVVEHTIDEATGEVTKEASCTEPGILTFTCTVCDGKVTKEIAAIGHDWSEDKASEDGTYVYKECSRCHETEIIEYLGCEHETTEVQGAKEATCTEAGYTGNTVCTVCGETVKDGEEIPATGHTEEVQGAKEATCTEAGYTGDTVCTVCGETVKAGEEIPATGEHTEEVIPGEDATCTEPGLTEGKKCSVCGEIIVAQEEIPATGEHTEEVIPGKDATCTEPGLTEGKKCSVCGEIIVAQEEIPAVGHNGEVQGAKDATCGEAGYTGDTVCTVCGEIVKTGEVIPATGNHHYDYRIEGGNVIYTCPDCHDTFTEAA